jgi:predicted ATPase/DNA-binding SARP family transcriptional activator
MSGAGEDPAIRYADLGELAVYQGDLLVPVIGRRLTTILGLLLVNVNQRVTTDMMVEALWGHSAPDGAATTLVSHLYRLRKLLEPARPRGQSFTAIVTETGGYRLVAAPDSVDSARFEDLASSARELGVGGQPERALRRCDEALELWRGRPWTPHSDEEWAATAVSRLEELQAQVRERRVDSLLGIGAAEQALVDADQLVAEHPLREHGWALRMRAAHRLGRTHEALETYQRARAMFAGELGIEPGIELRELQQRILEADPSLDGPRRETVSPARAAEVHLPRRRGPLFGRDDAIRDLGQVITSQPLVTVVGPAGCGKTRLAIEAARSAAPGFPDGVWYVDATAAGDLGQLVTAVVSELGLAGTGNPLDSLRQHLRQHRLLMILDCSPASVPAVAGLVEACAVTDIEAAALVASRQPLAMDGESVWALGPLPVPVVPTPAGPTTLQELALEPSVELFRERASAVGTVLEPGDLPVVARICAAIDGLPLAIELAAAQSRSFSLDEVLDWVTDDPTGLRDAGSTRVTSLSDVLRQSVDLLGPAELAVHEAASAIPGEFTPAVLATVADLPVGQTREALSGLVHRSLMAPLGPREPGGRSRFAQLAVVRSLAQGSMPLGRRSAYADRRNVWVVALTGEMPRLGRESEWDWFARLDDNIAAVRATLQDCLIDRPSGTGTAMASRLHTYWYYRGHEVEWRRWTRHAASSPAADEFDRLLAHLSLASVGFVTGRGDPGGAMDRLDAYAAPLEPEQSVRLGDLLFGFVTAAWSAGEISAVMQGTTRLGSIAERTNDDDLRLFAAIGHLFSEIDSADAACLTRVEELHRWAETLANHFASYVVALAGTLAGLRAKDHMRGLQWSNRSLAHLVRASSGATRGLIWRACLLVPAGEYFEAAKLLAAARAYSRRTGRSWPTDPQTSEVVALVESKLTPAERDEALAEGRGLELADLVPPA